MTHQEMEIRIKELEKQVKALEPCDTCEHSDEINGSNCYECVKGIRDRYCPQPCPNAISRSDMLDAIGHGTTYTSEDLQRIIKDLPPVNPQSCGDVISREDALLALTGEWTELTDEIIHRFIKRIKSLPPVNPQPKTGHWEKTTDDYCYWYRCSCCGTKVPKNEWGSDYFSLYCPECGAKMV